MVDQALPRWLADLASSAPTPGGGAAAAVNAAIGAALVGMVCELTAGRSVAADDAVVNRVRERAGELRYLCLELAEADARAFDAVLAAYRLPKDSDAEKAARSAAIAASLLEAADVPMRVAAASAEVIELAEQITDSANPRVVSDLAVAAVSAKAAIEGSAISVEVNLAALSDARLAEHLSEQLSDATRWAARADSVVEAVRARITR